MPSACMFASCSNKMTLLYSRLGGATVQGRKIEHKPGVGLNRDDAAEITVEDEASGADKEGMRETCCDSRSIPLV